MRGQSFYKALKIFLGVITYFEMMTFLRITTFLEVISLLGVTISLVKVIYSTESICVKDTGTNNTHVKNGCIRVASDKNAYIGSFDIKNAWIKGDYVGDAYIKDVNISSICGSTYKPNKVFIWYLTFGVPENYYLCL